MSPSMKKATRLYFNDSITTAHTIEDEHGQVYSLSEAKRLWESDQIVDCNLEFARLVHFDFDIAKTYASYK